MLLVFGSNTVFGQDFKLIVRCSDGLTGTSIYPDRITVGGKVLTSDYAFRDRYLPFDQLKGKDTVFIKDEYYDFPKLTISQYDFSLYRNTIILNAKGAPKFHQRIAIEVPIAKKSETKPSEVLFQVYTYHDLDSPSIELHTQSGVIPLETDYRGEGIFEAIVSENEVEGAELLLATEETTVKYICREDDWMRHIPIDMYEQIQWTDREIDVLNEHFEQYGALFRQSVDQFERLDDRIKELQKENERLQDSIRELQGVALEDRVAHPLRVSRPIAEKIIDFPDFPAAPFIGMEAFKVKLRNALIELETTYSGQLVLRLDINSLGGIDYRILNETAFDDEIIYKLQSLLYHNWNPAESGGKRIDSRALLIIHITD